MKTVYVLRHSKLYIIIIDGIKKMVSIRVVPYRQWRICDMYSLRPLVLNMRGNPIYPILVVKSKGFRNLSIASGDLH